MKETTVINEFNFYVEDLHEISIFSPNSICPPAKCQVVEGSEEIIISTSTYSVCVCKFCYCVKLIIQ